MSDYNDLKESVENLIEKIKEIHENYDLDLDEIADNIREQVDEFEKWLQAPRP